MSVTLDPNKVLPTAHELFAAHVANGMSARAAARACGFNQSYSVKLREKLHDRIEQLKAIRQEGPADQVTSQSWIESRLVTIIQNCMEPPDLETVEIDEHGNKKRIRKPQPKDYGQARLALMNLAELKNYLTPKKSESTKININTVGKHELSEMFQKALGDLNPVQKERVLAIARGQIDVPAEVLSDDEG